MVFFSKARGLVSGIGLIVIGIGVTVYAFILQMGMNRPAVDLYQVDWETLKPYQHVKVDIDFLMDEYMVYTEGRGNKKGETSRFYTLPDLVIGQDDRLYMAHFMGVAVPKSDFAVYERLEEASFNWWTDETNTVAYPSETIPVDGYLRKMSKNDKEYMREFLTEVGYNSTEIDEMMIPYVIMNNPTSIPGLMIAGPIVVLLGGAILAITIVRIKKDRDLQATYTSSNYGNTGYGGTYNGDYYR